MKVLELCLSNGVGGLELYALRTAEQLTRLGCECLAVVRKDTLLAERMPSKNIRTTILQGSHQLFSWLSARRLAKIIDQEAIDILHMHWGKDLGLAVLAKCFARRSVKLVYSRQMMITRPKKDPYHRFLYKHVDLYLAITRQLRDKARHYLPMPDETVQLLYYGISEPKPLSDSQRGSLRRQFGTDSNEATVIGLVGRIEANKGQHLLIEAVQNLRALNLPVHAAIIGPVMDAEYFSDIQARVEQSGLQRHITFFGSHSNPPDIMQAFDIIVLATEMETFGLVLIEAMRSRVAVVGSNAGGVPEIIEDGISGLLFEPGNATDLAAKLKRYISNVDERDRIAATGKQSADARFALAPHYRNLLAHFKSLTN
jgi:glycosyltransferase involved in cell wall biosynthesis